VDLGADHPHPVFVRQLHDRFELAAVMHPADGVVRAAQDVGGGPRPERIPQGIQVQPPHPGPILEDDTAVAGLALVLERLALAGADFGVRLREL
jgi:hypothetical protein